LPSDDLTEATKITMMLEIRQQAVGNRGASVKN